MPGSQTPVAGLVLALMLDPPRVDLSCACAGIESWLASLCPPSRSIRLGTLHFAPQGRAKSHARILAALHAA